MFLLISRFLYNHHYISREMSDVIDRLTASSLLPTIDHISHVHGHVSSQDWNSLTVKQRTLNNGTMMARKCDSVRPPSVNYRVEIHVSFCPV